MKKAKLLKAVVSAFAAAALTAVTAISSFAANTPVTEGSIVINNSAKGHTYEAYQIFDGDMTVADDSTYTLSNIVWGSGVDAEKKVPNDDTGKTLLEAIKADSTLGALTGMSTAASAADVAKALTNEEANAKAFATVVAKYLKTPATATSSFSDNKYTIAIADPGYYLVKDADESLDDKDDAYTRYMVQVLGTVASINPKSDKPTVDKQVLDDETDEAVWNDVADAEIGEKVSFKLTATLPQTDEFDAYTTYKLVFNDTLSKGLDFVSITSVQVGSTALTDSQYSLSTVSENETTGEKTFTVTIEDVKKLGATKGGTVTVEYTAKLNANAVIGLDGNPNTVDLTYSNNPNGEGTGKTPEEKVVVFTYELDTTKVDASGNKLENAKFVLKKGTGDNTQYATVENGKLTGWVSSLSEATILSSDVNGLFIVKGLDEGTYYLEETKAPDGFNKLANDITLVINATDLHTVSYDGSNASACLDAITLKVDSAEPAAGTVSTGIVSTDVVNQKGSSLPSTGGIGTTIFYVCGGIIVAAAAVLLIVKLRKREA